MQSTATITSGSTYLVKLKWKANKPAPGVSIFAGAGTAQTGFSPSRLLVELSAGGNPLRVVSSQLYQLFNSDGSSWLDVDPARLRLAVSPGASVIAIIGVNADVWSATAGLNQDLGIFVSRDGGADQLVAWTESGEGGAAYSPNASYVQAAYPMVSGSSYVIKLKWKANRSVGGSTIYAGAGTSATGFSPTSLMVFLQPAASWVTSASRSALYTLPGSDGTTWVELDGSVVLSLAAPADGNALLSASADLWTDTAGYNQDLGLFLSANGSADQLVAWKESGGTAAYSPNAVYVQASVPITHGVSYTVRLKWKANKPAGGVAIYAGAGTSATGFSPTRLTAQLQPPTIGARSAQLYSLADSDGATWTDLDAANLQLNVTPTAASTALVGANADLWTANSGYGEDLGIFVSAGGGADQLLAWEESGGSAGTLSPNAAYVGAAYHLNAGTPYRFKLKWKASQAASGATIYAGAGTAGTGFSPTSVVAQLFPGSGDPLSAARAAAYSLASSDGATWTELDPANLRLSLSPTTGQKAVLGAGSSLSTDTAGFNQDLGVFVSVNGGADQLLGWKESGGVAAANSANAAYVQAVTALQSGSTYVFKLKWKANRSAAGVTIHAGAGSAPPSGTFLTVSLID